MPDLAEPAGTSVRCRAEAAFTLVELLIVVIILGILAAIVLPSMSSGADEARRSRFCDNLRNLITVSQWIMQKNGEDLADAGSGELPVELIGQVRVGDWENGTPLGGVWDTEKDEWGVSSALGVHYLNGGDPGDAEFQLVDELIDDGDLATGGFRKLAAGRYYFILSD